MDPSRIYEGLIIAVVGAVALIGINYLIKRYKERRDTHKIEAWLTEATTNKDSQKQWRSTRAIASHNNLTEERVHAICSASKKIVLSTSVKNEDKAMWGIKRIVRP
ncbi:hypothetical protein [Aquimarina sp. 2201CG14-23]|uniref:hypothetical protein n=1 Tax=Aquimarina mycalae TaxID=3040073 RepID=UPI002477EA80|nr:hypothetical protein [Aquimarina sp. 2201CG14-23]MDH7445518.1 hypothetical protein [Aquimarina sp. 2201CG14-23]